MAVTGDVSKFGDDTNKHIDIGSSFELNLSFGDTLYLHPNDTGGSPIVTIKLTGTENLRSSVCYSKGITSSNLVFGFCKIEEVLHTLVYMVEKSELVKDLMMSVEDTVEKCIENDSC
ncbi:hypothetical protein Tco_0827513 [Tanacetum coccineum]